MNLSEASSASSKLKPTREARHIRAVTASVMHLGCTLRVSSLSTAERVHGVAWISHRCRLVTLLGNETAKDRELPTDCGWHSHAGQRMNVRLSHRRSINAH
ncbi:MAG: hypothetical protein QOK11_1901 [Pseudonocardiales bacterium]|nr:hypothetical protein [Pseudonocardiales bacterium]